MMTPSQQKDFKNMLFLYDDKKYKSAIEIVNKLLDSFPEHIECLTFKAMILN